MRISAVICEYNPFHKGHKYLHAAARSSCDALVSVMSTSFTQRGDTAIFSKYERARAALQNGADIVVELPAVYAVAPAQKFAQSGVAIVKALGCVDALIFGSECGNTELLQTAAAVLDDDCFRRRLKLKMREGLYYPRALSETADEICGKDIAAVFSCPNDILAVEYCRALRGSSVAAIAVKRKLTKHDDEEISSDFASSSHIRALIRSGKDVRHLLPEGSACENPAFLENIAPVILYCLRSMSSGEIERLPDVSEGLHNRIYSAVRSESTLASAAAKIKTKRYTMARIRRIFICALLGVTKEIRALDVPYIRVLGFTSTGERVLRTAKRTSSLPIVTSTSSALKELGASGRTVLEKEIKASDIFALARNTPQPCGADFTQPLVKIP